MSPTPPRPGLLSRLFRKSPVTVDDDAADLGTAFGLDFALDEPHDPGDRQVPPALVPGGPARWWGPRGTR